MITGDNARTAVAIARWLGVFRVPAKVPAEPKAGEIRWLQSEHRQMGMVGVGINDAPVLAQADVGWPSVPPATSPWRRRMMLVLPAAVCDPLTAAAARGRGLTVHMGNATTGSAGNITCGGRCTGGGSSGSG